MSLPDAGRWLYPSLLRIHMPAVIVQPKTPSERLLRVLSDYERFLVVMHDNPDPDVIASAWSVLALIEEKLHKSTRIVGGGAIVRAENKHMVELLQPPIQLVSEIAAGADTATVLVDCGLGTSNHLVTRAHIHPVAVIDHHPTGLKDGFQGGPLLFQDIRTDAAASASIAASYLREQHVDPGMKLATAILYAIRTETCGMETDHSTLDRSIVTWLTEMADPTLLAEIENAPLDPEYFGDLALAMQNTFVYADAAVCFLPRAFGAEIVGEVADLLIRCRGIHRVLCAAVVGDDLLMSVRTDRDCGDAVELLQATLQGVGGCGGHEHRAGGKISSVVTQNKVRPDLLDQLRTRWLTACSVKRQRGTRLVARREIFEHL
jgi:nanoRNase/pAp phosphatase (c-di-AMP/oligoRNAs hydrolase)